MIHLTVVTEDNRPSLIVQDDSNFILKLVEHKEGKFPFHVLTSTHANDDSILTGFDFPNLVSALCFVIAQLYDYQGKD